MFERLLPPGTKPEAAIILLNWVQSTPVAGIKVYNRFEVDMQPLRIAIDYRFVDKLHSYLFPPTGDSGGARQAFMSPAPNAGGATPAVTPIAGAAASAAAAVTGAAFSAGCGTVDGTGGGGMISGTPEIVGHWGDRFVPHAHERPKPIPTGSGNASIGGSITRTITINTPTASGVADRYVAAPFAAAAAAAAKVSSGAPAHRRGGSNAGATSGGGEHEGILLLALDDGGTCNAAASTGPQHARKSSVAQLPSEQDTLDRDVPSSKQKEDSDVALMVKRADNVYAFGSIRVVRRCLDLCLLNGICRAFCVVFVVLGAFEHSRARSKWKPLIRAVPSDSRFCADLVPRNCLA